MKRHRILASLALVVTAVLVIAGAGGFLLFNRAASDPLRRVDAIIVLGGEHDGREAYGVELAKEGYAPVVVLSNPYEADDDLMADMCRDRADAIEVLCERPDPLTTRGEAIFTKRLAAERNWSSVMFVTWRYHLPRAEYVFDRCLGEDVAVVARAVPRGYDYTLWGWTEEYLYQYAGFAKAFIQGSCP